MEYLKDERLVDTMILRAAHKRDGVCLYGLIAKDGCSSGVDAHHIQTKGSGGDDDLKNLICLCRRHHNEAHARRVTPEQLYAVLKRFYGYTYEDE
jgi:hypothetical protein